MAEDWSALEAVQRSLVARLRASRSLMKIVSGIYDGPPVRAPFPYIALATGASANWSHKTGVGRRLSLALAVYDEGESAACLHRVMALVEAALDGGLADPEGWQIVTFDFHRTRIVRRATSPWVGLVEYRALVLRL